MNKQAMPALGLLALAASAAAAPPQVVHDPADILVAEGTTVPYRWWGDDPLPDLITQVGLRPYLLEPTLCGRFAAPQTYLSGPNWVFTGSVADGAPGGALSIQRGDDAGTVRGWQVFAGDNAWTGATAVTGPAVLSVTPPLASAAISLGRRSLLCIHGWTDAPVAADWTPQPNTTITWQAPPAVLHVAGALTDASRLTLTVEQAPPLYPTPLIEADDGITGTPTISSLPTGWQVRQTFTTLYLEPIP